MPKAITPPTQLQPNQLPASAMLNATFVGKVLEIARKSGIDLNNPGDTLNFMKDVLSGDRASGGWLYQDGPFSMVAGELISGVIGGGSALMKWLPFRLVDYRKENVKHLEFIAPEGFDGSTSYRTWLRSLTLDECDFGPSSAWNGFEYTMDGASWSFSSPVLKTEDFGMRDYVDSPIYVQRGDQLGQVLEDDADWATARALFMMEGHMNYNVAYGDAANSLFEMDGLDTIIQPGYVQSKVNAGGIPHWANPLVVNAAGITDPLVILQLIRGMVRKLRNRLLARQWDLAFGDMVIWLPSGMWPYLADAHASGGNVGFVTNDFLGQMTYRDFNSERARITQGGVGFGFIDVDGTPVPVLPDPNIGKNVTLDPNGTPKEAVSGDIMILTRRAGGITMLEQQYLDYTRFQTPAEDRGQTFTLMNGLLRGGWKMVNNECFQYYLKSAGRLCTYFQPMQARLNNVSLETILDNENESSAFWSQDFYAFDGARGGQGSALLTPWN
jgi:hypothetical protein